MAKIILAEDDASLRHYLTQSLIKAGHNVESYANGQDAFEALKKGDCDLLLTDIVMPEMDGMELSRRARTLYPDLHILFITGFSGHFTPAETDKETLMTKPFHLGDLVQKINAILSPSAA